MPQAECKIDFDYGKFVKERLDKYVPRSERKIVHKYKDKEKQKTADKKYTEYEKNLKKYEYKIDNWKKDFVISGCNGARGDSFWGNLLGKRFKATFDTSSISSPTFMWGEEYLSTLEITKTTPGVDWDTSIAELKDFDPEWAEKWIGENPRPQKPRAPSNYHKSKPAEPLRDDDYYDEYIRRKRKYLTEVNCPICNHLFQYSKIRKLPFDDTCKECSHGFRFVYKKRFERFTVHMYSDGSYGDVPGNPNLMKIPFQLPKELGFLNFPDTSGDMLKTTKETLYIEYDGIQPTKPRPPNSSETNKKSKRKPITQDVMDKVWNRDGGECVQCGSKESLEFDHLIPVSKGGANTYRNLQLLCEECNRSKSDKIG